MTDQTTAELIAEANRLLAENQWTSGWGVESLAERLADALEAAERRAEDAERRLKDMRHLAVNDFDGMAQEVAREVLDILATAPTDALREVKAEVWQEGRESVALDFTRPPDEAGMRTPTPNPYRKEQP